MPQHLFFQLVNEIRPFARNTGEIPLEIQILPVMDFLASGSYQT